MSHKSNIPNGFKDYGNRHKLKGVSVVCDRCHKTIHGLESSMGTVGFYRMTGYWGQYRESDSENIVCDECMPKNEKYQTDYKKLIGQ